MNEFFQMLKKDHKELKGILGQLKETKESAPKKREELFQKHREELVPHIKAEEETFYPPLLSKKEAREDAMEGMEEHNVSDMVLKELEEMGKGWDQWGAKMGKSSWSTISRTRSRRYSRARKRLWTTTRFKTS